VTIGSFSFKTVAGHFIDLAIHPTSVKISLLEYLSFPCSFVIAADVLSALSAARRSGRPMCITLQLAIGPRPICDSDAMIEVHNGKAGI
jgi:hypothetical protein